VAEDGDQTVAVQVNVGVAQRRVVDGGVATLRTAAVGAGRRAGVKQIERLVGDQPLRAHRGSMPQGETCFLAADNPVEFVEAFAQNYTKSGYVPDRAPERLISAIKRAEGEAGGTGS
jgi:hypothetical protein